MDARMSGAPTDADRYPTLSDAGRRLLDFMREHPHAPIYRNQSGNRLTAGDLEALAAHARGLGPPPGAGPPPAWVDALIRQVFDTVPHYRALGPAPRRLADVAPVSRADLAADIARFVPDDVPTERMINFQTTGTTGHPLLVPSHPQVAGRYLAFHKRALARFGITPEYGSGRVGVVIIGHQQPCFTYVSVTPAMDESGLAKINLHPDDWRDPADRALYLDALEPEFVAGDPLSFAELLALDTTWRPRALLSVGMMLSDGLRHRLEDRFGCPLLDLYSMNEVGPIGVLDPDLGGHVLLQDRLWVEILDAEGVPLPDGETGEIAVTGGFNFCLPLLRYRTGDHGALATVRGERLIAGLQGRTPVRFRDAAGRWRNNIEVTHALRPLPIAQFRLHQNADGSLVLGLAERSMAAAADALAALRPLFGDAPIALEPLPEGAKVIQYTSALDPGNRAGAG